MMVWNFKADCFIEPIQSFGPYFQGDEEAGFDLTKSVT
jgi:hypothetical protein